MRLPSFRRYRPGWPALFVATVTVCVVIGGWSVLRNESLMNRWIHGQVVSLSDDELEPWLVGLIEQGDASAVSLIVQDLASKRPALRRAALRVLRSETDHWGTISPGDATPHALAMAEALRNLPEAERKGVGAELSAKILAWAQRPGCPTLVRGRILLALRAIPRPPQVQEVHLDESPPTAEAAFDGPLTATTRGNSNAISAPATTGSAHRGSRQTISNAQGSANSASPRLLVPAGERRAIDGDEETDWDLSPRPATAESGVAPREAALPEAPVPNLEHDQQHLVQMPTRELLPMLHGEQRAAAAKELQARGFDDEQLELAEHLSSSDQKERLQWTEALPRISNVDARAWLTWMTEDRNAEVRRTAVTLLGTSLDEATTTLLRRLATRDPDQSVRRLAAELVKRQ